MSQKQKCDRIDVNDFIKKYRERAYMSTGSAWGRIWYRLGILYAHICEMYDDKNYAYYYDFQEHDKFYEKASYHFFEKAAKCFKRSATRGNDLAIMNYAVYLFAFKGEDQAALELFFKASELGLAVADYQLWLFYKHGCCGVEKNQEKSEFYLEQYRARCEADERQRILAWDLDEDEEMIIGRAHMYNWFAGYSFPEMFDTPSAKPSSWKYL